MSLETRSDPNENIISYKSARPAVPIPQDPSEEEIAFDWTLSEKDIRLSLEHRGNENLCRFAVQLCILKRHGRFLSDYSTVPPKILGYLCHQLEISPIVSLSGHGRGSTESDYQHEVARHLGWKPFDAESGDMLSEWIFQQVSEHLYIENLIEKAENFLRQSRVVIPGPIAFEREVNSAHRSADNLIFKTLADQVPANTKAMIDRLLTLPETSGKSDFFRFADYPPEAKARHILRYLIKHEELGSIGIGGIRFAGVGSPLLRRLATAAKTYDAWQIRRFEEDKRYSLAACFLYETKKTLLDYLVEMHSQFMTTMERTSRNAWESKHRKLRKRVKRGISCLKDLAGKFLSFENSPESNIESLFSQIDVPEVMKAVEDCNEFEKLEETGFLENLRARYNNFRRYFPSFVNLDFQCEPGSAYLLESIEILRKLNSGELKALPPDVDKSFIPAAWKKFSKGPGIDRKEWEIALAMSLRDNLRSGNLFLPESRRHVSFWNLCYDQDEWQKKRPLVYGELGLPLGAEKTVLRLVNEFDETADSMEAGLSSNDFVEIFNNAFRVKREDALPEPEGTAAFRQLVEAGLQSVRIERLLMEVDALTRFSEHLVPLGRKASGTTHHYKTLMAALVAHGTNLGISVMSNSTDGITVDMLQHLSRSYLRDETIRAASTELVNYHRNLQVSSFWGEGTRSSSDGQRFGVQRSSLLSAFYPRYFGYYDRAVTVYTHTSDQFSVFSTKVISCAEREALYVLDGLLENDSDLRIREHFTDTHGYTEQLFGLCYLLGFSFMPRIRNFKEQRLYKPSEGRSHGKIDPLFSGPVDLDLIKDQWDSMVRVAASLKNGFVSANVVARRLASSGPSNRLARAFTALGRLVKTTYLLRYINNPVLRRQVQLQLNRGEDRQRLARYVCFGNLGEFRSGNYYEIMNKASCLSLLCNAILVYNSLRIADVLTTVETSGKVFSPETIARVSPLHHSHVIMNGIYDFSGEIPITS
ncbi:MAG: Tn3 family transposase [Desulfomonile sp.]|jgi:TnpA family transposase